MCETSYFLNTILYWKNITHSIHWYLVNVKYSCYKCVTVTLREMQNPSNSSQQCPTTCVFSSPSDKQDTKGIQSMNWALESRSQIQTVWICNFDLHVFCWTFSKGYGKKNMCEFDLYNTRVTWFLAWSRSQIMHVQFLWYDYIHGHVKPKLVSIWYWMF